MGNIRVAFINELYGTKRQGGEQEAMFALAKRLANQPGFIVDIYSYTGEDSKKIDFPIPEEIKLMPYIREIFVVPKLGHWVVKNICPHYDVLHTSSTTLFGEVQCSIPYIISLHAIRSQKAEFLSVIRKYRLVFNPWIKKKLKHLEFKCLSQAASLVVLRERMSRFLIDQLSLARDKITIIPNPVDTKLFKPRQSSSPIVLFVGRGTIPKGIDTLIKAAPKIKGKIIVVTKVISQKFIKKGEKVGITFRFHLPHREMPEIYNQARVFILPSLDEEQSLTILEAMVSGLPIVTTETGGGGLIKDQENGIIIPPRNPDALTGAINKLLDNPALAEKFGKTNRLKVEQDHSWEKVLEKYLSIYDKIRQEGFIH